MADFTSLIRSMKTAAVDEVERNKPVNLVFGTVVSLEPLQINVEQKLTLEAAHLILTRNVTDYQVEMSVDHRTEPESEHVHAIHSDSHSHGFTGGGSTYADTHAHGMDATQHSHGFSGRKAFTIHNGLAVGDEVVMIRMQGGQKYVVMDRLG